MPQVFGVDDDGERGQEESWRGRRARVEGLLRRLDGVLARCWLIGVCCGDDGTGDGGNRLGLRLRFVALCVDVKVEPAKSTASVGNWNRSVSRAGDEADITDMAGASRP